MPHRYLLSLSPHRMSTVPGKARSFFLRTSPPCIAAHPHLSLDIYPLFLYIKTLSKFVHRHCRFIDATLQSLVLYAIMAPAKLNPTSQPLAPSTATFDAPGSSFSTGKHSTALLEQNKPAAGSPTNTTGSSRSLSPRTVTAKAPANMSSNSAASGGWFSGWGKSKPAAARPTNHIRSKSWFGGGKTSGERGRNTTTSGLSATDRGASTKANTTTPNSPTLNSSTTNTVSGSVCGGDNDTSGDLGDDTREKGSDETNKASSTTHNATPIDSATGSIHDQAIQAAEETEEVQHQPTTFRAPYRKLSLEETRSSHHTPGHKPLEAEISSLKEQLRKSFEAQLSSERERDQTREECKNLGDTLKNLEEEISSLQTTNQELRTASVALKEGREVLQEEVSSMSIIIDGLKTDNTSLKESREALEKEVSSMSTTIDGLKDDSTLLMKIREGLQKEVNSMHTTMDELKADNTSLREIRDALKKEVSSMKTTIDELKADNASLSESRQALEKEVSSMKTTIDELKTDNTSLKGSRDALKREVSSMYTTIDELKADHELEISSLHTTIYEFKTKNISLSESKEALENALATEQKRSQQTLEDTRQALQKDLDTATSQITSLESQHATLHASLQSTQAALTEEKQRSREVEIRLEECRASETKLETYLRAELEKSQTLTLQQVKDLEKLRDDHTRLQLRTATLEKPVTKKHKITKNESQKLSEQNADLMRQLQQARAQSRQLAVDLAALEEKKKSSEGEAGKSKFSLRDIVRRSKGDGARPVTSYGGGAKQEAVRPVTARVERDRRSMFL